MANMKQQVTRPLSILLDQATYKELVQLARQNSRTVSGEARYAILRHLAKEKG